MDERSGNAILMSILATSVYRIVVLRRLLLRLEAQHQILRLQAQHRPPGAARGVDPVRPAGTVARVPRQGWVVRGGDGVALDPTIVLPATA